MGRYSNVYAFIEYRYDSENELQLQQETECDDNALESNCNDYNY